MTRQGVLTSPRSWPPAATSTRCAWIFASILRVEETADTHLALHLAALTDVEVAVGVDLAGEAALDAEGVVEMQLAAQVAPGIREPVQLTPAAAVLGLHDASSPAIRRMRSSRIRSSSEKKWICTRPPPSRRRREVDLGLQATGEPFGGGRGVDVGGRFLGGGLSVSITRVLASKVLMRKVAAIADDNAGPLHQGGQLIARLTGTMRTFRPRSSTSTGTPVSMTSSITR